MSHTRLAGLLLPALLTAPLGCSGPAPSGPEPDPNQPLAFVRTLTANDRPVAEFRLLNSTDEPFAIQAGVYKVEAWKDGRWVEDPLPDPAVKPKMRLAPGSSYFILVPWAPRTDTTRLRVGIRAHFETTDRTEWIWSPEVPAPTD